MIPRRVRSSKAAAPPCACPEAPDVDRSGGARKRCADGCARGRAREHRGGAPRARGASGDRATGDGVAMGRSLSHDRPLSRLGANAGAAARRRGRRGGAPRCRGVRRGSDRRPRVPPGDLDVRARGSSSWSAAIPARRSRRLREAAGVFENADRGFLRPDARLSRHGDRARGRRCRGGTGRTGRSRCEPGLSTASSASTSPAPKHGCTCRKATSPPPHSSLIVRPRSRQTSNSRRSRHWRCTTLPASRPLGRWPPARATDGSRRRPAGPGHGHARPRPRRRRRRLAR